MATSNADILIPSSGDQVWADRVWTDTDQTVNAEYLNASSLAKNYGNTKADQFNSIAENMGSCTIKVYKNIYAKTGTYTVNAVNIFGDINDYESFEAFPVLSGTFSASHWGRMRQTYQAIDKVTQPSKGIFNVKTRAGRSGWGSGSQSALYFDLIIVGHLTPEAASDRTKEAEILEDLWESSKAGDYDRPAENLNEILQDNPYAEDGVYWVKPAGFSEPFQIWCKIYDNRVWGCVWSNLRGKSGGKETGISWTNATKLGKPLHNTPWVQGDQGSDGKTLIPGGTPIITGNRETWEVYTPLLTWNALLNNQSGKFMYEWAHNYGSVINKRLVCSIDPFTSGSNYRLNLHSVTTGSDAGIYSYHRGRQLTTWDADHDSYRNYWYWWWWWWWYYWYYWGYNKGNCASFYSNTPFWYGSCWTGSIWGGGVNSGNSYYNGAYWKSSHRMWGRSDGYGAGNGWMFVSPN